MEEGKEYEKMNEEKEIINEGEKRRKEEKNKGGGRYGGKQRV